MELVGAVIVTYNPDNKINERLSQLLDQVNQVIIVDNNSNESCRRQLKEIESNTSKIKVILNDKNLGIATAINQALDYFTEKNYKWIMTLDHDSVCENGMVEKMFDTYNSLEDKLKASVAVIAPEIYDLNIKDFTYKVNEGRYDIKENIIQSGAIFNIEKTNEVGKFNEDLFVYFVDDEICEKFNKKNYTCVMVKGAKLYHEEGAKEKKKFLNFNCTINNYSNMALYYISRNSLYMWRKYKKWCYIRRFLVESIKVSVFDAKKTKYIISGFKDNLAGVKGGKVFK